MKILSVIAMIGIGILFSACAAKNAKKAGTPFVSTQCQMVCSSSECQNVCTTIEGTLEYKKK